MAFFSIGGIYTVVIEEIADSSRLLSCIHSIREGQVGREGAS